MFSGKDQPGPSWYNSAPVSTYRIEVIAVAWPFFSEAAPVEDDKRTSTALDSRVAQRFSGTIK